MHTCDQKDLHRFVQGDRTSADYYFDSYSHFGECLLRENRSKLGRVRSVVKPPHAARRLALDARVLPPCCHLASEGLKDSRRHPGGPTICHLAASGPAAEAVSRPR